VQKSADRGCIVVAGPQGFSAGDLVLRDYPIITYTDCQKLLDEAYELDGGALRAVLDLHCPTEAAPNGELARMVGRRGDRMNSGSLQLPDRCPCEDEAFRVLKIAEANQFRCANGQVLFKKICRINHSCNPNAIERVGRGLDETEIIAIRRIQPGEEVTISYLADRDLREHVAHRRELLRARWQFHCQCERCAALADPVRAFCCGACGARICATSDRHDKFVACGQCGSQCQGPGLEVALTQERDLAKYLEKIRPVVQAAEADLTKAVADLTPDPELVGIAGPLASDIEDHVHTADALHFTHLTVAKLLRLSGRLAMAEVEYLERFGELQRARLAEARVVHALQATVEAERVSGFPEGSTREELVEDLLALGEIYMKFDQSGPAAECYALAAWEMRAGFFVLAEQERRRCLREEISRIEDMVQLLQG